MKPKALGWHHLIDYDHCDPKILNSPRALKASLEKAARKGKARVIRSFFHQFSPFGVSGIVVIAESHISIHTWPEFGCATVDIFSCTKKMKSAVIARMIATALKPKKISKRLIVRGKRRRT